MHQGRKQQALHGSLSWRKGGGAEGVAADDDSLFNWIAFERYDGHGEKTYEFQYTAVGAVGSRQPYYYSPSSNFGSILDFANGFPTQV